LVPLAEKFVILGCDPRKFQEFSNHFSSKKLAPLNAEKRIMGKPLYVSHGWINLRFYFQEMEDMPL